MTPGASACWALTISNRCLYIYVGLLIVFVVAWGRRLTLVYNMLCAKQQVIAGDVSPLPDALATSPFENERL